MDRVDVAAPARYAARTTRRVADACVDDVRDSRYDRIEQRLTIAEALLTGAGPPRPSGHQGWEE
ncbi:hypothetical protein [Nocardia niigatensis]